MAVCGGKKEVNTWGWLYRSNFCVKNRVQGLKPWNAEVLTLANDSPPKLILVYKS